MDADINAVALTVANYIPSSANETSNNPHFDPMFFKPIAIQQYTATPNPML